jgi:Flp pilus assembly protein TadG
MTNMATNFEEFAANRLTALLGCDRGAVAVEFAFVAPVVIAFLFGVVEFTNVTTAQRRLEIAASSIAQMVAAAQNPNPTACNVAGHSGVTTCVNYIDLQYANDATMVLFPLVLTDSAQKGIDWASDISITISSVVFTKVVPTCTSSCTYSAAVSWSAGSAKRPCNTPLLPSATDATTPTPTTLPPDAYAAGSAIMVDLAYSYTPRFFTTILPKITLHRSAFLPPRNVLPSSSIFYSLATGDPGATTACS